MPNETIHGIPVNKWCIIQPVSGETESPYCLGVSKDAGIGLHLYFGLDSRQNMWRLVPSSEKKEWFYLESRYLGHNHRWLSYMVLGSIFVSPFDSVIGFNLWKVIPDGEGTVRLVNKLKPNFNLSHTPRMGLEMIDNAFLFKKILARWKFVEVPSDYTEEELKQQMVLSPDNMDGKGNNAYQEYAKKDSESRYEDAINEVNAIQPVYDGTTKVVEEAEPLVSALAGIGEAIAGLADDSILSKTNVEKLQNFVKFAAKLKVFAAAFSAAPVVFGLVNVLLGAESDTDKILGAIDELDKKIENLPKKIKDIIQANEFENDLEKINEEIIELRTLVHDRFQRVGDIYRAQEMKNEDLEKLEREKLPKDVQSEILDKINIIVARSGKPILEARSWFEILEEASYYEHRQVMLAGMTVVNSIFQALTIDMAFSKLNKHSDENAKVSAENDYNPIIEKFNDYWNESLKKCLGQPNAEWTKKILHNRFYAESANASDIVHKLKSKYPHYDWLAIVYPRFKGFDNHWLGHATMPTGRGCAFLDPEVNLKGGLPCQTVIAALPVGPFEELEGLPAFDLVRCRPMHGPCELGKVRFNDVKLKSSGGGFAFIGDVIATIDGKDFWLFPPLEMKFGSKDIEKVKFKLVKDTYSREENIAFNSIGRQLIHQSNADKKWLIAWLGISKKLQSGFSYACSNPERMDAHTALEGYDNTSIIRFR